MTRLAAACLVALVVAPAASAVAAWTPPERLSHLSAPYPSDGPQFADDGSGLAVFAEHTQDGSFSGRTDITRSPGGDWGARFNPVGSRGVSTLRSTVAGDGAVVLLGYAVRAGGRQRVDGLAVRYGRLAGGAVSYGGRQMLLDIPYVHGLDLAGNRAGEAAAVWDVTGGQPKGRGVFVARRHRGGRFGDAVRLRPFAAIAGTLTVAVGPGGHTAVAWRKKDTIFVATARPGHGFGPPTEIVSPGRPQRIALAAGRGGRLLAAWNGAGGTVVAQRGRAGGFKLWTLSGFDPDAAFDATGSGLVSSATETGPRVTTFDDHGWTAQTIAGPADIEELRLAVGRGGSAGLMILTQPDPTPRAYVALRGPTEQFGAAELVSEPDQFVGRANLGFGTLLDRPALLYLTMTGSITYDAYVSEHQPPG